MIAELEKIQTKQQSATAADRAVYPSLIRKLADGQSLKPTEAAQLERSIESLGIDVQRAERDVQIVLDYRANKAIAETLATRRQTFKALTVEHRAHVDETKRITGERNRATVELFARAASANHEMNKAEQSDALVAAAESDYAELLGIDLAKQPKRLAHLLPVRSEVKLKLVKIEDNIVGDFQRKQDQFRALPDWQRSRTDAPNLDTMQAGAKRNHAETMTALDGLIGAAKTAESKGAAVFFISDSITPEPMNIDPGLYDFQPIKKQPPEEFTRLIGTVREIWATKTAKNRETIKSSFAGV